MMAPLRSSPLRRPFPKWPVGTSRCNKAGQELLILTVDCCTVEAEDVSQFRIRTSATSCKIRIILCRGGFHAPYELDYAAVAALCPGSSAGTRGRRLHEAGGSGPLCRARLQVPHRRKATRAASTLRCLGHTPAQRRPRNHKSP